jgi:hypothetical protein
MHHNLSIGNSSKRSSVDHAPYATNGDHMNLRELSLSANFGKKMQQDP